MTSDEARIAHGCPFCGRVSAEESVEGAGGVTERERAIEIIRHSKETHVEWINYIRNYPEEATKPAPEIETAGDVAHHQECIDNYDLVLRVLEGRAPRW